MDSEFRDGARTALPIVISFIPFGLLFGALGVDNGLTSFDVVLASATIFAGASQMVGIELYGQKVAPWLIVLSIFAVNFRHVLYSAAIGRRMRRFSAGQKALAFFFLTDPQFAESEKHVGAGKALTLRWYMGLGLTNYLCWIGLCWLGALFGRLIPDPHAFGLDFLLPIYFLGLVMSFRKRPLWLPVIVASGAASVVAWHLVGSPWHVSLGAIAGILLAVVLPPRAGSGAAAEGASR
ncbi:MAG: branched-chain amino acid ABC transporter permease [Alphaproteobacteria bacterium]|nr:MAG: branched-chain amino acid ABC transporter permease [Alphaproteobacteria bacterium]